MAYYRPARDLPAPRSDDFSSLPEELESSDPEEPFPLESEADVAELDEDPELDSLAAVAPMWS